jgi:hypothetical protein
LREAGWGKLLRLGWSGVRSEGVEKGSDLDMAPNIPPPRALDAPPPEAILAPPTPTPPPAAPAPAPEAAPAKVSFVRLPLDCSNAPITAERGSPTVPTPSAPWRELTKDPSKTPGGGAASGAAGGAGATDGAREVPISQGLEPNAMPTAAT